MHTQEYPVAGVVREKLGHAANVRVALFDSLPELGHWSRDTENPYHCAANAAWAGATMSAACRFAIEGDLSAVAASDAMLAQFENYALPTARRETCDDAVGAVPNVPAFIAGHPMNMRRKRRANNEVSPIAVVFDTAVSAGISAQTIAAHGVAILAFVRALCARRPVELWSGTMEDGSGYQDAACSFVRLETAPMDLAHVAYALSHPSFARQLGYSVNSYLAMRNVRKWPFDNHTVSRNHMRDILAPAFPHVSEMLCVPAVHVNDKLTTDPQGWVAEQLAIHGAYDLAAA